MNISKRNIIGGFSPVACHWIWTLIFWVLLPPFPHQSPHDRYKITPFLYRTLQHTSHSALKKILHLKGQFTQNV